MLQDAAFIACPPVQTLQLAVIGSRMLPAHSRHHELMQDCVGLDGLTMRTIQYHVDVMLQAILQLVTIATPL